MGEKETKNCPILPLSTAVGNIFRTIMTMGDDDRILVDSIKRQLTDFEMNPLTDFDYVKRLEEYGHDVEKTILHTRQYLRLINSHDFVEPPAYREIMDKYCPYGFINILGNCQDDDKDQVIYIDALGMVDIDGVLNSVPSVDWYIHRFYCAETILRAVRKHERDLGRRIDLIFIYDMEGLKFTTRSFSLLTGPFLYSCRTLLKYYAATTSKVICVNVPHFGSTLYNAFTPFLSEKIRKKVFILGSNWKTEILHHVDPNVLPVHYGGNLVDENNDPKCPKLIVYPTEVPSNLYYTPSKDEPELDDLKKLTIHARKYKYITVEIDDVNSSIEWFYNTVGSDWGFGVFYTEDEREKDCEKMDMVFPQVERLIGAYHLMERGKIQCKKRGFYKLWFSNLFSWTSKLHVHYKIDVIKPS